MSYTSIQDVHKGLEAVCTDKASVTVIEFNDRCQRDLDGHRDLQLTISIEDMVCELQLNTDVMAYVKEHSGHRDFEVRRELLAAVAELNPDRCQAILAWAKEHLGQQTKLSGRF